MKRSKLALLPLGLALLLAACASDPLPIPQHSFGVYATASTPSAAFRTLADPQGKAMLVALKPSLTYSAPRSCTTRTVDPASKSPSPNRPPAAWPR
ncbi:hypothetical protein Q029_05128 [Pseudomonas aeruginosa BWHPSA016]|uniref:hypothetical protein n=1 Tax=Pseudomonas aeruginosa TaxID=287 RepID=UPI0003B948C9|nr:hypothetical protein [Pseudomonas aeruginosa]ERY71835.1 hypothetical protein Q029_05128 [Pseudomonas aeruginosa BWHPSA016]